MRKTLAATSILVSLSILACVLCPSAQAAQRMKHGGARQQTKQAEKAKPAAPGSAKLPAGIAAQTKSLTSTNSTETKDKTPQAVCAQTQVKIEQTASQPVPSQPTETSVSIFQTAKISTLYDQSRYDDCAFWVGDDSGLALGSDDLSLSVASDVQGKEIGSGSLDCDVADNARSIPGTCFLATELL